MFTKFGYVSKCALGASVAMAAASIQAAPTVDYIESTLEVIADDAYEGRTPESNGLEMARTWLVDRFVELGVTPAGEEDGLGATTFYQSYTANLDSEDSWDPNGDGVRTGKNIVGIVYPPGTEGQSPTTMVTAHYDGINGDVGHCVTVDGSLDKGFSSVCNAAVDNAAGVGALLAVIEDVKDEITSPMAVILFDGEEDLPATSFVWGESALIGSTYFAQNPTFDNSALRLHINLESVGYNLFTGMEDHILFLGAHSGGSNLNQDVGTATSGLNLDVQYAHYGLAQQRTDVQGFIREDWPVPYIVVTNGPGSVYHSNADQYRPDLGSNNPVNVDKVLEVAKATSNLLLMNSAADRGYVYDPLNKFYVGTTTLYGIGFGAHQTLIDLIQRALDNIEPTAPEYTPLVGIQNELKADRDNLFRRWFWSVNIQGYAELLQDMQTIFDHAQSYTHRKIKNEL